jgi:tetratricopeptide (TPR) repeat protein
VNQLDIVIAARPDVVELKIQKAQLLARTGQAGRAEVIARELVADPKSAAIGYRILGEAAYARSDYAAAAEELLKAEANGQPFASVGLLLVNAYVKGGKADEAAALLQKRLAKEPKDADSMQLLAGLRATQGQFDEAEKLLRGIIALQPEKADAYLLLAQIYSQRQRGEDAVKILKEAMQRFPANQNVSLHAAIAFDSANELEEARALYEQVLARSPGNLVAANNLAALIADAWPEDRAKLDRARQLAEKFRLSGDPLLLDTLGWVLVRQTNFDDAVILLERSASTAPNNQQIQYHYGVALQGKGLKAKAKEALAKAVAGQPSYRGMDDARALAATLN